MLTISGGFSIRAEPVPLSERFLLPYRDGYKTVRVSDINHIETENKTVYLRLNNGTSEVVNMSMDELEQATQSDCFFVPTANT